MNFSHIPKFEILGHDTPQRITLLSSSDRWWAPPFLLPITDNGSNWVPIVPLAPLQLKDPASNPIFDCTPFYFLVAVGLTLPWPPHQ
jgi:hypothetical protein